MSNIYKIICTAIHFHATLWEREFKQIFSTVKTPQQEFDKLKGKPTYHGYKFLDDGKTYKPAGMIKKMREKSYSLFENNYCISFFLMSISSLDQKIQNLIDSTGYKGDKNNVDKFCDYIRDKLHNNIDKDAIFAEQYGNYRTLYNFLKHNNGSYYEKLKNTPLCEYLINKEFTEDSLSYEYCRINCQFIDLYLLFMKEFVDTLVKNTLSEEEYKNISNFNADGSDEYLLENEYINCCVWSDVINNTEF